MFKFLTYDHIEVSPCRPSILVGPFPKALLFDDSKESVIILLTFNVEQTNKKAANKSKKYVGDGLAPDRTTKK